MADITATSGSNAIDQSKRMDELAKGDPAKAGVAPQAAPSKIDPVAAAKVNEDKVSAARSSGVASPQAAKGEPPLPKARPDVPAAGVPDIKINPRHPLQEGSGMKGHYDEKKQTQAVQKRLQDLGFSVGQHVVDGKFGKDTADGVRKFQEKNGLPTTGKVDKATWDKMRSDKAVKNEVNNDPVAGTSLDPGQTPHFYEKWDEIAKKLKSGAYKN